MVGGNNINIPKSSYYVTKECCENDGKIWMDEGVLREYLIMTNGGNTTLADAKIQEMKDNALLYPQEEGSLISGACFNQLVTPHEPPPIVEGCFDNGQSTTTDPNGDLVTPKYPGKSATNYGLQFWPNSNVHNVELCEWKKGCTDSKYEPPLGNYDVEAAIDDGSCYKVGCMDNGVSGRQDDQPITIIPKYPDQTPVIPATNYDENATRHDPTLCQYGDYIEGCMDQGIPNEKDIKNADIDIVMEGYKNPNYDSTAQIHNPEMCCDPEVNNECEGCHDREANNYVGAANITKTYPCPDDDVDGLPDCCTYDPPQDFGYTCFKTYDMSGAIDVISCKPIQSIDVSGLQQNGKILYLTSDYSNDAQAALNACKANMSSPTHCGQPLGDNGYKCINGECKDVGSNWPTGVDFKISDYGSKQAALDACLGSDCGKIRIEPKLGGVSCIEGVCTETEENPDFQASVHGSISLAMQACRQSDCVKLVPIGCPCDDGTISLDCCPDEGEDEDPKTPGYNCVETNCVKVETNAKYRVEDYGTLDKALDACKTDPESPCKPVEQPKLCEDPDACNNGQSLPCIPPGEIKIIAESDSVYILDVQVIQSSIYNHGILSSTDDHLLPRKFCAGSYSVIVQDGEGCLYQEYVTVNSGSVTEVVINHNCPKETEITFCEDPTACNYNKPCQPGVDCCEYGNKINVRFPAVINQDKRVAGEDGGRTGFDYRPNAAKLNVKIKIQKIEPSVGGALAQLPNVVDSITFMQYTPDSINYSGRAVAGGYTLPTGENLRGQPFYNKIIPSIELCPGTYKVTVTDNDNCEYDETVVLSKTDVNVDVKVDCKASTRTDFGGVSCENWSCIYKSKGASWELWDYMTSAEQSKCERTDMLWLTKDTGGLSKITDFSDSNLNNYKTYRDAKSACASGCVKPYDPCEGYSGTFVRPSHGDYFIIQKFDYIGDIRLIPASAGGQSTLSNGGAHDQDGNFYPSNKGVGKGNPVTASVIETAFEYKWKSGKIKTNKHGEPKINNLATPRWDKPMDNHLHEWFSVFVFFEYGWRDYLSYNNAKSKDSNWSTSPHIRPTGWYSIATDGRLDVWNDQRGRVITNAPYDDWDYVNGKPKPVTNNWVITQKEPPKGTQIFGSGYNNFDSEWFTDSTYNAGTPFSGARGPKTQIGGTNGDPCCWNEGNYANLGGHPYGNLLGTWDYTKRNASGSGCAPNTMDTLRFIPTNVAQNARASASRFNYNGLTNANIGLNDDGSTVVNTNKLKNNQANGIGWLKITNEKVWYVDNSVIPDVSGGSFWIQGVIKR